VLFAVMPCSFIVIVLLCLSYVLFERNEMMMMMIFFTIDCQSLIELRGIGSNNH